MPKVTEKHSRKGQWLSKDEHVVLVLPDITKDLPPPTGDTAIDRDNIPTKEFTM